MLSRLGRVLARKREPNEGGAGSRENKQRVSVGKIFSITGQHKIRSVVFTADGKHVLSGGSEEKIRCLRTDDGKEVGMPMDAGRSVYDIAVSQDGKWVVSGGYGGTARVFDRGRGDAVTELKGHRGAVRAVDVSLDGTRIATGSSDKTARVWALSNGDQIRCLQHDHGVVSVKFSLNGLLLATATWMRGSIRIYDCASGHLTADFEIEIGTFCNRSIAWHHDGKHLFAFSLDGYIHHMDASTGRMLSKWFTGIHSKYYVPRCIALANDSAYIAVSNGRSGTSFWDVLTQEQIGSVIEHSGMTEAIAISAAAHDIVTSSGKTITLRNLRDVLPAHYCDSTRRNLQDDLTSLQRRFEAQSRQLASTHKKLQIIALTTELDRRKISFANKMAELAAVRDELDELPDVSYELVSTRGDLRATKTRIHSIHQHHNDWLREIIPTIAASQLELPNAPQFNACSDAYAEQAIVLTLQKLNTHVQRTSKLISAHFIGHARFPDFEEQSSAMRRASQCIPPSLLYHLRTYDHALYLPIALQAYLTSHLYSAISSWTTKESTDKLFHKGYDRLRKSEPWTFTAGWRSLIATQIPDHPDDAVSRIVQGLSDIVVAAGCASSTFDAQAKMSPKFLRDVLSMILTTRQLRKCIGEALAADFKASVYAGQTFDDITMHPDGDQGVPAGGPRGKKVLCTTRLGLMKELVPDSPYPGQKTVVSTVFKAAVILRGG